MSHVRSILEPNETVLIVGRMHWIIYFPGMLALVIGLALLVWPMDPTNALPVRLIGGLIAIFGLWHVASCWLEQWTTEIAVTDKRVIQKRGLIWRKTGEMNMDKVESVLVDQSLLGRILNYGSIVVRGTGSGIEGLHHIANPLRVRSAIVVR